MNEAKSSKRKRNALDNFRSEYFEEAIPRIEKLQPACELILEGIQNFSHQWDLSEQEIARAELAEEQINIEFQVARVHTLQTPYSHLYIQKLELLRNHGFLLEGVYYLISDINRIIHFIRDRIARIKDYCGETAAGPHVLDMVETAELLVQWKDTLSAQIEFVGREMFALINSYKEKTKRDGFFKESIEEKLTEKPELYAWVAPFLDPNRTSDPLLLAMETLKNEYPRPG